MNSLIKIATITNLVAEIGDCDEVQFSLDGFIKVLTELKTALAKPPKKVVMKYQLDADGNRIGEGVIVPNTFPPHPSFVRHSSLDLKDGEPLVVEEEEDEDLRTCDKCGEDRYKNGELMRYDNMVENEEKDEWYCKGCADDSVEPCNCNSRMDIRGRCDPIKSAKQFAECSARVDTAYFHICNDYDKWEVPRRECWKRSQEHELLRKVASAEPYCLTAYELDEILELKEQDEENEDEFNCLCCGNFVSCAEEEDEGRYEGDDIICGDCVRNHYCDECDNFYEDEGFLAEYEKRLCCEECIEELKKQEESDEE